MTDIKPENRAFYWATIFLRSLQQSGVEHIVISPGSRSTPLAMAAAALPDLKKHVIMDERSAAFFALGIGKATNQPAALICTSGTAVANYYPGVIEAKMSGVPLLLLTSDRPPRLQNTGANQTINQHKIFGQYPVFFHDVGEPVIEKSDLSRLQKLAEQAHHYSHTRQGPVHLNFPFSKPLEPNKNFVQTIADENHNLADDPSAKFPDSDIKSFQFKDDILYEIHATDRLLIIIGQLTPDTKLKYIFGLAEWLEAPVLSEQGITDTTYAIQGFEGFLRNEQNQAQLEPDLILRFGRQPASKSLLQAIECWQPNRHIYFSEMEQISDIANTTTDFINWNGKYFNADKSTEKDDKWLKKWKGTEEKHFEKSTSILTDCSSLTDGHIYHHLVPTIPNDWSVFVSNSFPVRDQSMFGQWSKQAIFTNRGASGIDGITSTAMGITVGRNQPGVLFTGDLAFLHDTNALLNANKINQPLVVVVINNQGGSIFRMLPIADHDEYFETYFETPQNADITKLSKSYGIKAQTIKTVDELEKLGVQDLVSQSDFKLTVLECRTNPVKSMQLRKQMWDMAL